MELDSRGYLITDQNQATSVPGVYGAGDVCVKNLRQVVTAVSDGAVAATSLEKYVSDAHERLGIPKFPVTPAKQEVPVEREAPIEEDHDGETWITPDMKEQLKGVFDKFQSKITVKALLDESPLAEQMEGFIKELSGISENVVCSLQKESQKNEPDENLPVLTILKEDGKESGIRFYGIPGGHEFNSFVIGLYNAAGPGQQLSKEEADRIKNIEKPMDIQVAVSLSCTMCPTTVMSAGRIAAENEMVKARTFDLAFYPELKERYQIMSVPCMIINQQKVEFGKKSVEEMLSILETI